MGNNFTIDKNVLSDLVLEHLEKVKWSSFGNAFANFIKNDSKFFKNLINKLTKQPYVFDDEKEFNKGIKKLREKLKEEFKSWHQQNCAIDKYTLESLIRKRVPEKFQVSFAGYISNESQYFKPFIRNVVRPKTGDEYEKIIKDLSKNIEKEFKFWGENFVITEKVLKERVKEYIKPISRGEKFKEAFWDYIQNESKYFKKAISDMKKFSPFWQCENQQNYEEKKRVYLDKYIDEEYKVWKSKYDATRSKKRVLELEKEVIPTHSSTIKFPSIDADFQKKMGTTLAVLQTIINYCEQFTKSGIKNIAENAFVDACIIPIYDYCSKSFKEYEKSKKSILNFKKTKQLKKDIINTLCSGDKCGLARIVQVPTRLLLLSQRVNKAQKIADSTAKTSELESIYEELRSNYSVRISKKDFIDEKSVEFRRATKVLLENMNKNGVGDAVSSLINLLLKQKI